jgi:phage baseplate assembly protein W
VIDGRHLDFPYSFDAHGRTAATDGDDRVRDLIEQVLFTSPGERVNRPDFGSGLLQLVFSPNSEELATATRFLVQGSLQQWLGDLIEVEEVEVTSSDDGAVLEVTVGYVRRLDQQRAVARFRQAVA